MAGTITPTKIRSMKIRVGGETSFILVDKNTTYNTRRQPTPAELATKKSSLAELGQNWVLIQPPAPVLPGGLGVGMVARTFAGVKRVELHGGDTELMNIVWTVSNGRLFGTDTATIQVPAGWQKLMTIEDNDYRTGPDPQGYRLGYSLYIKCYLIPPGRPKELWRKDPIRTTYQLVTYQ